MDPIYLQAFLDESDENIQFLNQACMELEAGRRDDGLFSAMFRAAHTLKGMSATMGFSLMSQLTHRLEDLLSALRAQPGHTTPLHIDTMFRCIDRLETLLQRIRADQSEGDEDVTDILSELEQLWQASKTANVDGPQPDHGTGQTRTAAAANGHGESKLAAFPLDDTLTAAMEFCRQSGAQPGVLRVRIAEHCQLKGARAVLTARQIEAHADILACVPDAQAMEAGAFDRDLVFLIALHSDLETLVSAVQNVSEVESVSFTPYAGEAFAPAAQAESAALPASGQSAQTPAQTLPASGQPAQASAAGEAAAAAVAATATTPRPTETSSQSAQRRSDHGLGTSMADTTIRVSVHKLDALMNVVSELTVDKHRLSAVAASLDDPALDAVAESMERLLGQLQSTVMSLRLVPVQVLFQRFPRMVRDLAKSLGKEIHLEMTGTDTELDRTIIDEMGEVLVHLIRNAADHGLEPAEERIAAGKPAAGSIRLAAYPSGQHVVIEVADDGRGIQVDRIRQKAVERGLVSAEVAAKLPDEQVYSFMFASGFSTAETVSDVSGRGVGLDAVKAKAEALGGRIWVESQPGLGTTFSIQLPLTLAIIDGLLVEVCDDVYAIPLSNVAEVVKASRQDVELVHGAPVLKFRGQAIPVIDAGERWYGQPLLTGDAFRLVICREGRRWAAVAVSRYLGHQQVVNKPLGAYLRNVRQFSGATILGDGRVALIVDVHAWLAG